MNEERVPREDRHRNGAAGIAAIAIAVADLAGPRHWGSAVLGRPGEEVRHDDLGARGLRFRAGPHALEFIAPEGASPLSRRLADRGPGPWSVTLKTLGDAGTLPEGTSRGMR